MHACKFGMNGGDGRLHLKGEAEELRDLIDRHCCQSGAVPGTNLSTEVSTINWGGRVCIAENIRYEQTFAYLSQVAVEGCTHPPQQYPLPFPFFLVSISYGFSPSFLRIWINILNQYSLNFSCFREKWNKHLRLSIGNYFDS